MSLSERLDQSLEEIVAERKTAKPYAVIGDTKVYTPEDLDKVLAYDMVNKNTPDLGEREVINGGMGYTQSKCRGAAMNPELFFTNYYKKVDSEYYVVTDYLAIKEKEAGKLSRPYVEAYVVSGTKTTGKLKIERMERVKEEDFINEYQEQLSVKAMINMLVAMNAMKPSTIAKKEFEF